MRWFLRTSTGVVEISSQEVVKMFSMEVCRERECVYMLQVCMCVHVTASVSNVRGRTPHTPLSTMMASLSAARMSSLFGGFPW